MLRSEPGVCCSREVSLDPHRRFWQDHFLAGYYSYGESSDPTIGIDYAGRIFQILGGKVGTLFGYGCWGTNTTTGYVQARHDCGLPGGLDLG